MNQKNIIAIVIIVLVLIGGGIFINHASQSNSATTNPVTSGTSAPLESLNPNAGGGTATTTTSYTLATVAQHNSRTSCWTTINGKVYDVTSWIDQHPGGQQAILSLCGTDGSAAFNGQHGGQARPEAELATFIIGDLK